MTNPTPEQFKAARMQAGLTQPKCAAMLFLDLRRLQRMEAGESPIHPLFYKYLLEQTGQDKPT